MANNYPCRLQILSAKHKDILHAVDKMLDKYASALKVHSMIARVYHEDISLNAIRNYKIKHWQVFKDMVQEQKAAMTAISEMIGEDGLTAAVNALLWQELQGMTATQLMAFKKICNDSAKVALLKKQFALYAQEHRQKMKERSAQAGKGNIEVVEDFEAARRMVEQAKEIFGIGTTATAPPVHKLLGAVNESPSPEVYPAPGRG